MSNGKKCHFGVPKPRPSFPRPGSHHRRISKFSGDYFNSRKDAGGGEDIDQNSFLAYRLSEELVRKSPVLLDSISGSSKNSSLAALQKTRRKTSPILFESLAEDVKRIDTKLEAFESSGIEERRGIE
jgi:hypothetical protein